MKNLNDAIQFILGLDINSVSSADQSIPKQLLPELIKYLLEQRFNDKESSKIKQEQLEDIKIQLEEEKKNISKQEEYIVTLKEEIENLKYFINQKDQDNQKRYVMLSESSHSRIGELIQDLEKQKENTSQLRNLQKQMRQKCLHIKTLQSSLAKSGEQIQFLKKLRVKNDALMKQISELKFKISLCQKSERNALLENEQLREKLSKVQEQNQQLQYIINNQISKVKQLTNEYFGSSKSNLQMQEPGVSEAQIEKLNLKHQQKQQNANYLKKVEQSFINEYLMEIKPFQSNSTKHIKHKKQQTNLNNDMEFQFSLQKASQSLNEKEIQSSSKSKGFNDYFMDINLNESKSLCPRKQSSQNAVFCKEKINAQDKDQEIFPLSMKKEIKLDESQIKLFQMQKKLERKVKKQKSFGEDQPEVLTFSRDISRILQTKSKQIDNLNEKLEKSQARKNEIEKQLEQLDRSRMDQIKMFEEEIYSQIAKIEKLNHELKQQNIKNVELSRKQQFYSNQISDLQKLCAQYEIAALQHLKQIQNEKNAVSELSRRLLEIEQEKWANLQTKNILKVDCSVETTKIVDRFIKAPAQCIHIDAEHKNKCEKSTSTFPPVKRTKQYQICNLMTMEVKNCKSKIKMLLIKTVDLIISNKLKFDGKLNSKVCSISLNTASLCLQGKSLQATDDKVLKKYEQKEIQVDQVDQEKEGKQKLYENGNDIKYLQDEQQKKNRGESIKKFVPTSLKQQIIEQLQLNTSKRNNRNMRYPQIQLEQKLEQTLYFSVCEQNEFALKKQQEQLKKQNIELCFQSNQLLARKQKSNYSNQIQEVNELLKIKQILQISSKLLNKFEMKALPDISKLELKKNKKKVRDIITSFQDHKKNGEIKQGKEFFLVSGLLERDCQLTTDRILIWKEGIISFKLQKYLIMAHQKKFIYDPVNCILGNCEVIIHLHDEAIEVKRKEKKNYFLGNMQDCYWKVLEVDGAGYF